jgi:hypothetical protein
MYRIPKNLDLSPVVGKTTTQLRVGKFDLQFTFGEPPHEVDFYIESPVDLFRAGELFAHWEEEKWPDPGFYEIMDNEVTRWEVHNDRLLVLVFANGIEMHLEDAWDNYESMTIWFKGNPNPVII